MLISIQLSATKLCLQMSGMGVVYVVIIECAYAEDRKVFIEREDAIAYAQSVEDATYGAADTTIEWWDLSAGIGGYVY